MKTETAEVKNGREFDISSLWRTLKKFWVVLLVVTLAFTAISVVFTRLFEDEKYVGTARFWVNGSTSSNVTSAATMGAAQMATNYANLVVSPNGKVVQEAVEKGGLAEKWQMSTKQAINRLEGMITAGKTDEDSFMFYVKVTSTSPEVTADAIMALQDAVVSVVTGVNGGDVSTDSADYITLVSKVSGPQSITKTSRPYLRNAIIAAAASLIIAYAVCFIIFIRDTVVYDEAAIKARFNQSVLGSIPGWSASGEVGTSGRRRGFGRRKISLTERDYEGKLMDANTPFAVKEAFNMLRTNVSYTVAGKKVPVFAITSAHSGAGKSLMSANLSQSFAALGKKTLIIECDMRCPTFSRIFGVGGQGLSEHLAGISSELNLIKHSEFLSVIVAGRTPPNPSELLASEEMRKLIEAQKQSFDVIILDTPPICEVTDAGVLSASVDGYILAVRSGYSDMRAVDSAFKLLGAVNANVVGFILNDVNPKNSGADGYYVKKGRYATYAERASKSE